MRDFIFVRDCADVVLWLLDHPDVSGIYNLGTGQARTWLDLAHAMFAALDRDPVVEFFEMPDALKGRYQYFTQAEMGRLRAAGYDRPFTSLEDGVADYIHGYLKG
jgi:ADP-L-glycero-D-manno-heptose 6-epimerase